MRGPGAAEFVNECLTNDLSRIGPGQAQYTMCCLPDGDPQAGGVIDDLIVYLHGPDDVLLVPNAANAAEVLGRLADAAPAGVTVTDRHEEVAVLAVQGPRSLQVLELLGVPGELSYMSFVTGTGAHGAAEVTVCRTGYTGEHGYELLVTPPVGLSTPLSSRQTPDADATWRHHQHLQPDGCRHGRRLSTTWRHRTRGDMGSAWTRGDSAACRGHALLGLTSRLPRPPSPSSTSGKRQRDARRHANLATLVGTHPVGKATQPSTSAARQSEVVEDKRRSHGLAKQPSQPLVAALVTLSAKATSVEALHHLARGQQPIW